MVESDVIEEKETAGGDIVRIYEVGYTIVPTVKEEDIEKTVGSIVAASHGGILKTRDAFAAS